jgi:hypothetical protein
MRGSALFAVGVPACHYAASNRSRGCAMVIRGIFRWLWHQAACLVLGCAKFAAWCVTIAAGLSFGFVLAAQLTRFNQASDWRSVPFSDFLQILRIDAPTGFGGIQAGIDVLLALPATLVLLVAATAAFGIKKSLDAVATWHSRRSSATDQSDIISSIERALAKARKLES